MDVFDVDELRWAGRRENSTAGGDWTSGLGDLLLDAAEEIERLRAELAAASAPTDNPDSPVGDEGDPAAAPVAWPPLMRAGDVDALWQDGPWKVAIARRNAEGVYDWLPLNEVCTQAADNPFLPDNPNLLVVAMPWEGVAQAPFPAGAARYDVGSGEPFDQEMMDRFEAAQRSKALAEADPAAGEMFATDYIIDAFDAGHDEHGIWQVRVVWRGRGLWAVQRGGSPTVLNRDGEWEHEASPSNRDDDFLARCRFSFDEATSLAADALAVLVGPGGRTASEHAEFRLSQSHQPAS